jgi:hypothetical protein
MVAKLAIPWIYFSSKTVNLIISFFSNFILILEANAFYLAIFVFDSFG